MLRFFKSFRFALQGFRYSLHEQTNIKIQIFCALVVLTIAFYCKVSRAEWIALLMCVALVISLEMINTSLEDLVDMVKPEFHPVAGRIKDIAAAAVLFASVISAIIGMIVFYPYFFN